VFILLKRPKRKGRPALKARTFTITEYKQHRKLVIMPATHKVEIFKSAFGENWGNVYLIDYLSAGASFATIVDSIASTEQSFHSDQILFEYARVSTLAPSDNDFVTIPLAVNGQRIVASPLPLFVTLRVDIAVQEGGRPSRKYYRGVLGEDDITATAVSAGIRTTVADALSTLIDDLRGLTTPVVDPQGQEWNTPIAYTKPQMRQLHRKRRRAA